MRTFVKLREVLSAHKDLAQKIAARNKPKNDKGNNQPDTSGRKQFG